MHVVLPAVEATLWLNFSSFVLFCGKILQLWKKCPEIGQLHVTVRGSNPIQFSRLIEIVETNDAFKHNLDLKECPKQVFTQ